MDNQEEVCAPVESKESRGAIENIHHRMDTQDKLLSEIRDMLIAHVSQESSYHIALEELVVLWRGSKVLIPIITAIVAAGCAVMVWAKEHIK